METKITDVKGLHSGKSFQEKLLLKNATSPDRDLLAMKLLGIKEDILKKHVVSANTEEATICKKVIGDAEIEDILEQNDLRLYNNETLKILFDTYETKQTVTSSRLNVSWTKHTTSSKKTKDGTKTAFKLDEPDELEKIVKDLLNYESEEGYQNLLLLLPVSDLFNTNKGELIKLGWDIYEQSYNSECYSDIDAAALLTALQILERGKLSKKTCFNLVKDTCFINNFNPIDFNYLNEEYSRTYFISSESKLVAGYNDRIINVTTVDKKYKPLKKTSLRNINKEEFDAKESRIIEQALNNNDDLKRDEKVRVKGVDIRKVEPVKKSQEDTGLDMDFETIAYGLRVLLTQVPGVLCKIKIPFNKDYFRKTSKDRKIKKSDTLILGPKYWIEFLENSSAEIGAKPGADDRKTVVKAGNNESTEAVYDFGYCIHHMGYLTDVPKKPDESKK